MDQYTQNDPERRSAELAGRGTPEEEMGGSPSGRAIGLIVMEVLLLAALVVLIVLMPRWLGEEPIVGPEAVAEELDIPEELRDPIEEEPAEPEPDPPEEPVEIVDVDPEERGILDRRSARTNDTFWDLADEYWGSRHLWPDLYRENLERHPDPDFIDVGASIVVPETLAPEQNMGPRAIESLMGAYVLAYEAYRDRADELFARVDDGETWLRSRARLKRNRSRWLVYSATRFQEDFVEVYRDVILKDDVELVEGFLERFGRPPWPGELEPPRQE